jgi:hypothetical protein
MIEDSGWALVCDFGVARAFGSVSLTQTGASLGTPRYMSPEQFEGQPVDGRCDQYSLAILVWEALTGGVPFTGDSLGELIRKHLLEPPPRLAEVKPEIPERISAAVYRAMSKKPAERFPDIAAFVAALGGEAVPQIPAGFTGPTPVARRQRILWETPDTPTVPIPSMRRRRRFVVLSLAVGLVLGSGGVWVALHPTRPANGATPPQTDRIGEPARDTQRAAALQPADTAAPRRRVPAPGRPAGHKDPKPPVVPAATPARLWVNTQPVWGELLLDNTVVGPVPVQDLRITPGQHRVVIRRDGFIPFDTTFTVVSGQEIRWTKITLKRIGG